MRKGWKTTISSMLTAGMICTIATPAVADIQTGSYQPGDEMEIPVVVQENPSQAVAVIIQFDYDHNVFELIDTAFAKKDTATIVNLNGVSGEVGKASFRIKPNVAKGKYQIEALITSASDIDESSVENMTMETVIVSIGKETPKDTYYADGKIRTKVELNADGNLLKTTNYNRYSRVSSEVTAIAWDENGNAIESIRRYTGNTGKYAEHHDYYTYDARGNELSYHYFYADGTPGSSWETTYDEKDHIVSEMNYDEDGQIISITEDYVYDEQDNIVSFTEFDGNRNVVGYYRNEIQDGTVVSQTKKDPKGNILAETYWDPQTEMRIERIKYDSQGKITDHYVYDPIYGDQLSSKYTVDGDEYNEEIEYLDDRYIRKWESISRRNVSTYDVDGQLVQQVNYNYDEASKTYQEESTTVYSTNAKGETVEDRSYVDGSRTHRERAADGSYSYYTRYDADGKFAYSHYDIYENGRTVRSDDLNEKGEVESSWGYEYDENGLQTSWMRYDEKGILVYYYTYEYDDQGNRTRENRYDSNKHLERYTIYTFDWKGVKTKETEYDASGKLSSYTVYRYDSQNRKIYSMEYRADGSKYYEVQYRYLEDGSYQRKSTFYKEDGSIRSEYDWE